MMKQHKKTTGTVAIILVVVSVIIEIICQVNMNNVVNSKVNVKNPDFPTIFSGKIKSVNKDGNYNILFDQEVSNDQTNPVSDNIPVTWVTIVSNPNTKLDHRLRSIQKVCLLAAITLMVHAMCA